MDSEAEVGRVDPAAVVRRYIDAFNEGDAQAMAACFAEFGTILDGMPPHVWNGPSAASQWYRDVLAEGEHAGASGYHVTLGEPHHNAVSGDAAYFVAPATMTFILRGKVARQVGALFTVALRNIADEWRIASWAWSKGQPGQI